MPDALTGGHPISVLSRLYKMMSDVLHSQHPNQGNAHPPPPPSESGTGGITGGGHQGGGVAGAGGRGVNNTSPSLAKLKKQLELYRENMRAQTKQHKEKTSKLQKKFMEK